MPWPPTPDEVAVIKPSGQLPGELIRFLNLLLSISPAVLVIAQRIVHGPDLMSLGSWCAKPYLYWIVCMVNISKLRYDSLFLWMGVKGQGKTYFCSVKVFV